MDGSRKKLKWQRWLPAGDGTATFRPELDDMLRNRSCVWCNR